MIKEFLDSIQQRIVDAFSGLAEFVYLAEWYTLLGVVLLAAMVIGYFLPFKWVRAGLGMIVLLMAATVAGVQAASNHFKLERQRDRDKIKELQAEHRQKNNNGWFS